MSFQRMRRPDGDIAEFDRDATERAYTSFAGDPCACAGCRNFRAAFRPDLLDAEERDACTAIGIDMTKAVETTCQGIVAETGLLVYTGHFPFMGRLVAQTRERASYWNFGPVTGVGTTFPELSAALYFSVLVPWALPEPCPY